MQTGASCAWSFARAAFLLWLVLAIVGVQLANRDDGWVANLVISLVVACLPLFFTALYAWVSVTTRPSDIFISDLGVRFEGGSHHGTSWRWRDFEHVRAERVDTWNLRSWADSFEAEDPGEEARRVRRRKTYKDLQLTMRVAGKDVIVAEGELPIEERSLEALAKLLRAGRGKRKSAITPDPALHVLLCGACGASVAPSTEETKRCGSCAADVPLPEDVRTRVGVARELAGRGRSLARSVAQLLDQTHAIRVNRLFLAVVVFVAVSFVVGFAVLVRPTGHHRAAFVAPFLCIGVGYSLMRLVVASRAAAAVLHLDFGAIAPVREGAPYECRACGGPLPDAEGSVVVPCVYCEAENVVTLELQERSKRQKGSADAITRVLDERRRERARWWRATLIAALALVLILVLQ